jgi:ribosomal protein S27AE
MSESTFKEISSEKDPQKKFKKWVQLSNVIVFEREDGSSGRLVCGRCGSSSTWIYPMAQPPEPGKPALAICNRCGLKPDATIFIAPTEP